MVMTPKLLFLLSTLSIFFLYLQKTAIGFVPIHHFNLHQGRDFMAIWLYVVNNYGVEWKGIWEKGNGQIIKSLSFDISRTSNNMRQIS
jgi:hypothetical protein